MCGDYHQLNAFLEQRSVVGKSCKFRPKCRAKLCARIRKISKQNQCWQCSVTSTPTQVGLSFGSGRSLGNVVIGQRCACARTGLHIGYCTPVCGASMGCNRSLCQNRQLDPLDLSRWPLWQVLQQVHPIRRFESTQPLNANRDELVG